MATLQNSPTALASAGNGQSMANGMKLPALSQASGMPADQADNRSYPTVMEVLSQPLVRKSLPAIAAVFLFAIFLIAALWLNGGEYRALHPGMSEVDRSEAMTILQGSAIPVQVDSATGALNVPVEQYYDARMALAAAGLPRDVNSGTLDYFDQQTSMTTSQFMEEARYTAAIENELAKSITRISTVQSARVHIASPRQSNFIRNRATTKASVIVTPYSGRSVSQPQVEAIVNLVASSIPFLATTDVSVVDDRGNLLTSNSGSLAQANEELAYQQSVEQNYKDRIDALLAPLLGEGAITTKVDVSMDFTVAESTVEEFDRNGTGPLPRSESTQMDMSSNTIAEGIPGATANVAPDNTLLLPAAEATALAGGVGPNGEQVRSSQSTRNYELDRTIRHVRDQVGVLNRISVAIAVDEAILAEAVASQADADADPAATEGLIQQEIEKLTGLVRAAIGFDETRGDVITIVSSRFYPDISVVDGAPWYDQPTVISLIKYAIIALLTALFMMIVVRPVVKLYMPAPDLIAGAGEGEMLNEGDLSASDLAMLSSGDAAGIDEIKAKLRPKKSSISADMLDTANTYDDKVALIRLLVAEDSARVANVLKKLIKPL
jgi:flagellar M-ring protein FliF